MASLYRHRMEYTSKEFISSFLIKYIWKSDSSKFSFTNNLRYAVDHKYNWTTLRLLCWILKNWLSSWRLAWQTDAYSDHRNWPTTLTIKIFLDQDQVHFGLYSLCNGHFHLPWLSFCGLPICSDKLCDYSIYSCH